MRLPNHSPRAFLKRTKQKYSTVWIGTSSEDCRILPKEEIINDSYWDSFVVFNNWIDDIMYLQIKRRNKNEVCNRGIFQRK